MKNTVLTFKKAKENAPSVIFLDDMDKFANEDNNHKDAEEYVAGPWHSAFGEICESLIILNRLKKLINKSGNYNVYVNPSMHSKTIGHGKSNLNALSEENIFIKVISDKNCDKGQIKIEEVR